MKKYSIYGLVMCLLTACSESDQQSKIVFADSVKLFESFEMKKAYDEILEQDLRQESMLIDSIGVLLEHADDSMRVFALRKDYYVAEQLFNSKFDQLSAKYTQMVTERLNAYMEEFGKERDYDLLLSGGNGSVLYVKDKVDVTEELIDYVNMKFEE